MMTMQQTRVLQLSLILAICAFALQTNAMDQSLVIAQPTEKAFNCTRATEADIPELLELIALQAASADDRKKVVVLPKKFREMALASAIRKRRLFVVRAAQNRIIGMEKLFILSDEDEKIDILKNEIRAIGQKSVCLYDDDFYNTSHITFCFKADGSFHVNGNASECVMLYDGGSYTMRAFRGKGANSALIATAYDLTKEEVCTALKAKNARYLVLLFGLTNANAGLGGEEYDQKTDRTEAVSNSFVRFAESIERQQRAETRKRLKTALLLFQRFGLSKDVGALILSTTELKKDLIYALSIYYRALEVPERYRSVYNTYASCNPYHAQANVCETFTFRYPAFMPTFDPESEELRPLPDDQSIPGYGNAIVYLLNQLI